MVPSYQNGMTIDASYRLGIQGLHTFVYKKIHFVKMIHNLAKIFVLKLGVWKKSLNKTAHLGSWLMFLGIFSSDLSCWLVTPNGALVREILPKMAETFRLRIYNKLPRCFIWGLRVSHGERWMIRLYTNQPPPLYFTPPKKMEMFRGFLWPPTRGKNTNSGGFRQDPLAFTCMIAWEKDDSR